eukprot:scaffold7035_cov238-Skeletonema_marinoi.AAC.2
MRHDKASPFRSVQKTGTGRMTVASVTCQHFFNSTVQWTPPLIIIFTSLHSYASVDPSFEARSLEGQAG